MRWNTSHSTKTSEPHINTLIVCGRKLCGQELGPPTCEENPRTVCPWLWWLGEDTAFSRLSLWPMKSCIEQHITRCLVSWSSLGTGTFFIYIELISFLPLLVSCDWGGVTWYQSAYKYNSLFSGLLFFCYDKAVWPKATCREKGLFGLHSGS